jgi:hypothetical protein
VLVAGGFYCTGTLITRVSCSRCVGQEDGRSEEGPRSINLAILGGLLEVPLQVPP